MPTVPRRQRPTPTAGATDATSPAPAPRQRVARGADAVGAERDRIFEYIKGLHATHLLAFGQSSGAFGHIRNREPHGISAAELAEQSGWTPDYARFFLEAAYALGVLDLASEAGVTPRSRYRFAPRLSDLLADDASPRYIGDYPRYHTLAAQDYQRLPELFRTGKSFPYALHGEEFLRTAAVATRSLPHVFLEALLPRIPELRRRLEDGAHLLDVGCGAGWAVVHFAERYGRCRIVGVDAEPNAIEMAKTLLTMRQLTQRADVRLVRGEEIDYEAEFDVVTFFLVLHAIPPRQKPTALAHAARALRSGGLVLIMDEAYPERPEEFRDPARQLVVVDQWIEAPWGHRLSTPTEHRRLLSEAGLRVVREVDEGRYYAVLAQKP